MAITRSSPAYIARRMAERRDRADAATVAAELQMQPGQKALDQPLPELAQRHSLPADSPARANNVAGNGMTPVINLSGWRRECFTLPPREAREAARAWLDRYPKSRWRSEIENWRVVDDDLIQVTLRRLPQEE